MTWPMIGVRPMPPRLDADPSCHPIAHSCRRYRGRESPRDPSSAPVTAILNLRGR